MNSVRNFSKIKLHRGFSMSAVQFGSELGSGAGKGGGGGGSIREAGGAFGKKEAAQEEQYFRKLQAEQLNKLKTSVADEITFHEDKIKEHQQALQKAKDDLKKLDSKK